MTSEESHVKCNAICPKCDGKSFVSHLGYASGHAIIIIKCESCGALLAAVSASSPD
jgi:hypothetical protein